MEKAIVLYKMANGKGDAFNQISKSQSKSIVGLLKGRFNCKAMSTIQVLVSINIIYSDIQDSLFAKILYHSVDSCFRNFAFTTMAKAVSCWKRIISPKTNNNSYKRTSATTDHERVRTRTPSNILSDYNGKWSNEHQCLSCCLLWLFCSQQRKSVRCILTFFLYPYQI